MLTVQDLRELADTMIANDIGSLELKCRNYSVRMVRAPGASSENKVQGLKCALVDAVSPITGPFQPRGHDDGLPELGKGAQVLKKEPLGYIGIGVVRVPCLSPATGRLVGAFPTPHEVVAAGETLFIVEPSP